MSPIAETGGAQTGADNVTGHVHHVDVQRVTVTSRRSFKEVMAAIDAAIGHPQATVLQQIGAAPTYAELERIVRSAVGPSGFFEFLRLDVGEVLRKANGPAAPKSLRLIVGNSTTMKQLVEHVPDAASYAPLTILIDERGDGVQLSYDRLASALEPYGSAPALDVARSVDVRIEALLVSAAT